MSARSFGSLFMVASCAGAALGCYLVSLRVASERASLEDVETKIVLAQRDMRMIQTEIGTRGRLSQLERWNAGRFAPPPRACRPEGANLRAGRQAGFPGGARTGREPPLALGAVAQRGADFGPRVERRRAMSGRSFHSLFMVASCAAAALGCYLVSLRVASERAALEDVETKIVLAQRDLRVLQTEIGTRGRLAQLERWNVRVLALSAPAADQFLSGGFELARLTRPEPKVDFQAPVVLASAPAPESRAAHIGEPATDDAGAPTIGSPRSLIHEASLKTETREVPAKPVAAMPAATALKSTDGPVTTAKPVAKKSADKPGLAAVKAADKKSVDKPVTVAAKPVTKRVQLAKNDPLAPLPEKRPAKTSKDSVSAR